MISSEVASYYYPQIPIESPRDTELLWTQEMEYMLLQKKKYVAKFSKFNQIDTSDKSYRSEMLEELSTEFGLKRDFLDHEYKTYKYLNGETMFYSKFPDWFGYVVLGRDFLAMQSKSRQFSFFKEFQVDYQRTFMDPFVYRMGVVAARGCAKSWLNMYCGVEECTIKPGTEISILGGSEKQSKGAYEYARAMVENEKCGIHFLIEDATKDQITFKPRNLDGTLTNDGLVSKIFNQAASDTSTRGPRATKLVFDEVTQISPDLIESTIGQAITSPEIKIIWGGTPDDPAHMAHTDWWCNPPDNIISVQTDRGIENTKCHHWMYLYEPDPVLSWHLFHWDVFDCHIDKGGWISEMAIRTLSATYKSRSKRRREMLGIWTAQEGNILKTEDIEAATNGYDVYNLPLRFDEFDGFVVAVDGARHRHYSTIVIIGFKNFVAHVIYARGWTEIEEPKLRKFIIAAVDDLKRKGGKNIFLVVEEAPISATLIDNLRSWSRDVHVRFYISTFKHNKLNFVDHTVEYFETQAIRIPLSFINLINELEGWQWSKNRDQKGRKLPEKGDDDFRDALMHGLMSDFLVFKEAGLNKNDERREYAIGERYAKTLAKAVAISRRYRDRGGFR